jgi:hypothetical protein
MTTKDAKARAQPDTQPTRPKKKKKGRIVLSLFKAARERHRHPSTSRGGGVHDLAEVTTNDKASCPRSRRQGMREVARSGHPVASLQFQSGYYR